MTSPSGEWKRIKAIFDAAVAAADREAYLAEACGSDVTLRRDVEALLASHERARTFLESPAGAWPGAMATRPLTGRTIGSYEIVSLVGDRRNGPSRAHEVRDEKPKPAPLRSRPDRLVIGDRELRPGQHPGRDATALCELLPSTV